MSTQLYNRLRGLDRGIATAYRAAVGEDFTGAISRREADAIFARAIDRDRITPNEAEALHRIIEDARFGRDVQDYLIDKIREKATKEAIYQGTKRLLLEDEELAGFYRALGMGVVGDIHFHSPRTGISYSPNHYQAIKKLVDAGDIFVYELEARELNESAGLGKGVYRSSMDHLFLYEGMSALVKVPLIVHEVTHAIQDWLDITATVKYVEADAYIAHAVACRALGRRLSRGSSPLRTAYHTAVPLVMDGSARGSGRDWKDAYEEVVAAVEDDDLYDHKKDDPRRYRKKGEHNERRQFLRLLRALKRKNR